MVGNTVIVWDLETIPDIEAAGRMFRLSEETEEKIRETMGSDFPKHPLHKIACIGALIAERNGNAWYVSILGAPHIGDRSEASLIEGFVAKIARTSPPVGEFQRAQF